MPLSTTKLFPSRETIFLIMPFFHCRVRVVVFNTTVNKISVILWQSVLLVEKTTDLPFHCRGRGVWPYKRGLLYRKI
jgi:hypothetical protein